MKITIFSGNDISTESSISHSEMSEVFGRIIKSSKLLCRCGFVLDFYNEMRRKYFDHQPNTTHAALITLEKLIQSILSSRI